MLLGAGEGGTESATLLSEVHCAPWVCTVITVILSPVLHITESFSFRLRFEWIIILVRVKMWYFRGMCTINDITQP